jgi:hypothetical protein
MAKQTFFRCASGKNHYLARIPIAKIDNDIGSTALIEPYSGYLLLFKNSLLTPYTFLS